MATMIYCRTTRKGTQSFYMIYGKDEYYLFSQAYRKSVKDYYRNGVILNKSMDHSRSHNDMALERTMSKIPMYVKYIEKEYGIAVFEQTKRKNRHYVAA